MSQNNERSTLLSKAMRKTIISESPLTHLLFGPLRSAVKFLTKFVLKNDRTQCIHFSFQPCKLIYYRSEKLFWK